MLDSFIVFISRGAELGSAAKTPPAGGGRRGVVRRAD